MITPTAKTRTSYNYTGATYYLEGLIGGIPYQRKQIARLREDLQIMKDEAYNRYHSPNLSAWDDGSFQAHRTGTDHNQIIDVIEKEKRIMAKIEAIEAAIRPVEDYLEALEPEAAEIIQERYWKHRPLEVIGNDHCMSRETVRRVISRVLLGLESRIFEA